MTNLRRCLGGKQSCSSCSSSPVAAADRFLVAFRFKSEHNDEICAIVMPALEQIDAELTPAQREKWQGIRDMVRRHAEATVDSVRRGE